MSSQPALPLTRIVVREQMRSARVPSSPKSLAQFQSYTRITFNVADVSRLRAMLCHQPELASDTSIPYRSAPWLPRLPPFCFEQRISGQRQTHRKRELDRRVQHVFLKRVNDPMLHFRMATPVNSV